MINIRSNERGITMLVLVITVLLLAIITGTISIQNHTTLQISNLTRLQNDIEALDDRVAVFWNEHKDDEEYAEVGGLPVYTNSRYNMSKSDLDFEDLNSSDGNEYYTIKIDLLQNLSLNYGESYSNPASSDRYIINAVTHQIYYVKGVAYDGFIYHTAEN